MARRSGNSKNNSTARIGFEAKLWLAADKLRSNMDAAEYKHTVLGLTAARHSIIDARKMGKLVDLEHSYSSSDRLRERFGPRPLFALAA